MEENYTYDGSKCAIFYLPEKNATYVAYQEFIMEEYEEPLQCNEEKLWEINWPVCGVWPPSRMRGKAKSTEWTSMAGSVRRTGEYNALIKENNYFKKNGVFETTKEDRKIICKKHLPDNEITGLSPKKGDKNREPGSGTHLPPDQLKAKNNQNLMKLISEKRGINTENNSVIDAKVVEEKKKKPAEKSSKKDNRKTAPSLPASRKVVVRKAAPVKHSEEEVDSQKETKDQNSGSKNDVEKSSGMKESKKNSKGGKNHEERTTIGKNSKDKGGSKEPRKAEKSEGSSDEENNKISNAKSGEKRERKQTAEGGKSEDSSDEENNEISNANFKDNGERKQTAEGGKSEDSSDEENNKISSAKSGGKGKMKRTAEGGKSEDSSDEENNKISSESYGDNGERKQTLEGGKNQESNAEEGETGNKNDEEKRKRRGHGDSALLHYVDISSDDDFIRNRRSYSKSELLVELDVKDATIKALRNENAGLRNSVELISGWQELLSGKDTILSALKKAGKHRSDSKKSAKRKSMDDENDPDVTKDEQRKVYRKLLEYSPEEEQVPIEKLIQPSVLYNIKSEKPSILVCKLVNQLFPDPQQVKKYTLTGVSNVNPETEQFPPHILKAIYRHTLVRFPNVGEGEFIKIMKDKLNNDKSHMDTNKRVKNMKSVVVKP